MSVDNWENLREMTPSTASHERRVQFDRNIFHSYLALSYQCSDDVAFPSRFWLTKSSPADVKCVKFVVDRKQKLSTFFCK